MLAIEAERRPLAATCRNPFAAAGAWPAAGPFAAVGVIAFVLTWPCFAAAVARVGTVMLGQPGLLGVGRRLLEVLVGH